MANSLTGDFDVVAQFSIPAANRVLAAMHRSARFLHSATMHVDDNPPPGRHWPFPPVAVSVLDEFGEPVANQRQVGKPSHSFNQAVASDAILSSLDPVVNLGDAGFQEVPPVPSHLQGIAQLQLFPPTVEVADATGQNVRVNLDVMARYLADPGTSPVAQFIRGDLHVTTSVNQVTSQMANVINFDFKANNASVSFVPSWSSSPISPDDLAGINLLIKNAITTSALPSSMTLPSNIRYMRFRTFQSGQNALAVLLNLQAGPGNPASMNSVFLGGSDDFAVGVSVDYIRALLQPTINNILSQTYSFTIPIDFVLTTAHVSYDITLSSVTVDLQNGKIVLTVQGTAKQTSGKWYAPDSFSFTATLDFTLSVDGDTADLIPGDVSLNTSSWVVNLFQGAATSGMKEVRDQALQQSGAYSTIQKIFSAQQNLGGLFQSLFTPPQNEPGASPASFQLKYQSLAIQSAGIVAHGSLGVSDWPVPYIEYEQIAPVVDPHNVVFPEGPAYSALKTWIPGGTINRYEWSTQGAPPFLTDEHTFVYQQGPGEVSTGTEAAAVRIAGFNPLCLTVQGTRLSASGPVVAQAVEGKLCGFGSFPVIGGLETAKRAQGALIALTMPSAGGHVTVVGHTATDLANVGTGSPNRLVHFADDKTAGHLEFLTHALKESGRHETATAVLAVLSSEQLSKARFAPGVIYGEAQNNSWGRIFGVNGQRPHTLIAGPTGDVLWRHDGELDTAALASALRKYLVKDARVELGVLRMPLRTGRPAPNFVFEIAPGQLMPLRKLKGRPVVLVFWRSYSKPSIEAVRDLQASAKSNGDPVLFAVNDGEGADTAKKVAAENGFQTILLTDPERRISFAYGVSLWPSVVYMDASGVVSAIRYGRGAGSVMDVSSVAVGAR